MVRKVELLVHAGAPSTRQDDNRKQAQALAYLAFNGTIVSLDNLDGSATTLHHHEGEATVMPRRASGAADGLVRRNNASKPSWDYLGETQVALEGLESEFITSSLAEGVRSLSYDLVGEELRQSPTIDQIHRRASTNENVEERLIQVEAANHARVLGEPSLDPYHASESDEPSLSSYLVSPVLDRHRKEQARDVERFIRPEFPQIQGTSTVHAVTTSEDTKNKNRRPRHVNESYSQASSELPTSYSLSCITSESSRAHTQEFHRSASDPGPSPFMNDLRRETNSKYRKLPHDSIGSDCHLSSPVFRNAPDCRTSPRRDIQHMETNASEEVNLQSGIHGQKPGRQGTVDQHRSSFEGLSTVIQPPPPVTSDACFTSHITGPLHFLADKSVVSDSFKPIEIKRELRPLERGHWRFDPSSWSHRAQVEFWVFLEKMVGNGDAGWGVWCTRVLDETRAPEENVIATSNKATSPNYSASMGRIQVFCWGEVVKHVYLVLYVASKSHVRKLGLQWIDAEGNVVVQMRGH